MKNRSIMLVAAAALMFFSCQKEADSISPDFEMDPEAALKAYLSEGTSDSTDTGCNGKKPHGRPPRPEDIIKHLDADMDGLISQNEAKGPLAKEFSKADANQDGFITLDELKAFLPPPPKRANKKK